MRQITKALIVCACVLGPAAAASAQGTIAGVVRDTSGAVLPGVTVEAASPVLIEKVRTVVTDSTGQFRIVDLRPGSYVVTFTLTGFSTVKREGIELTGSFTASVNAELRVGEVAETITVTGAAPIVDVQSAGQQRVIDREVIDSIPAGRSPQAFAVLVPGAVGNRNILDVSGAENTDAAQGISIHGGRFNDQIVTLNGVHTGADSGYTSRATINMAAIQEVAVETSSVSAEYEAGGARLNLIPREGGNTFSGTFLGNFTNSSLQGDNFSEDLRRRGLATPGSIRKNWDVNPGFGGPFLRDRLWFFASGRVQGAQNYAPGMFHNKNFNNPNVWTYEADLSRPASNDSDFRAVDGRLTWQAARKHKIGFMVNYQENCSCPAAIGPTVAPEANPQQRFPNQRRFVLDYSSPMTNRLLIEAGASHLWGESVRDPYEGLDPQMITVVEQTTGLKYRAGDAYRYSPNTFLRMRAAISYITGAHAFKAGVTHSNGYSFDITFDNHPITYRLNNGVPNQLTMRATPYKTRNDYDHDFGLYGQDKWTMGRLTLSYGIRYDFYANSFPEQVNGPALLVPTRNITFPAQDNLRWHDVTPKSSAAYDLFGDGTTALKVSLNKYLQSLPAGAQNPAASVVNSATRAWTDANGNFIPDCNLQNLAAQDLRATGGDLCGAISNSNFGSAVRGSTFDPELARGWGKRQYNWEFSAGVTRQLLTNVAVDVGYFRRWYGNFVVTDNRALRPSDFDRFSITVPGDSRLPDGGGDVLGGFYDLNPAKFGVPADNFITSANRFGGQTEYWHGVDVNVRARHRGILFQGGVSTGRTVEDECAVRSSIGGNPGQLATAAGTLTSIDYCRMVTPFLTRVSGLGAYTIPRVDVQIAATFQSLPGPNGNNGHRALAANYNAPNAAVQSSLGRPLSGGAANVTVNLVAPGTVYGERLNNVDFRVAKILRFGGTRTTASVDLFNLFNVSTVLTENVNYAVWRTPTSIQRARYARISFQFDF